MSTTSPVDTPRTPRPRAKLRLDVSAIRGGGFLRTFHAGERYEYRDGYVRTVLGIMLVYSEPKYTLYRLYAQKGETGRLFQWTERVARTERGAILKAHSIARRFGKECGVL